MKTYVGTKIIKAEPMNECTFYEKVKQQPYEPNQETRDGYHVMYDNNYSSWSPKNVFENAYRLITESEIKFIKEEA